MRISTMLSFLIISCTIASDAAGQARETPLPSVPIVKATAWPRNAIDSFILARIETEQLVPSSRASRYVLARRASLTLTGLPPSPDQLNLFINDKRPNAYDAMIDRLLTCKAHREYWAILKVHHKKPADVKTYAQGQEWAMVLWEQSFARKLNPAAHPQLINHLAILAQTNSDARILRLLVTSATYRQSSKMTADQLKKDKENIWLARYRRRRLPGWVTNRSVLFLSGLSNKGGRLIPDKKLRPKKKPNRKSTPLSALLLLNTEAWVSKCSAAIARRILTKGGKTTEKRFRYAALLVLGRPFTKRETERVTEFIRQQHMRYANDANLSRRMRKLGIEFAGSLVEAAAWTDLSMAMINMQEFATRDN